jgi:hypothetical protein
MELKAFDTRRVLAIMQKLEMKQQNNVEKNKENSKMHRLSKLNR